MVLAKSSKVNNLQNFINFKEFSKFITNQYTPDTFKNDTEQYFRFYYTFSLTFIQSLFKSYCCNI